MVIRIEFCYAFSRNTGLYPNKGTAPEDPMSAAFDAGNGKITVPDILRRKTNPASSSNQNSDPGRDRGESGRKIVCLTAYDYPTARLVDEAGVDIVLVGDSLGMVVLGYENTLPLTMEEMLHHTRAVRRGVRKALLVADMPYGSFHGDKNEAVRNAVRFVKEAGAEAVKIEGGERRMELIAQMVEAEIPVMGHIGLTPQSLHAFGGFRVQGKTVEAADQLLRDARAVEAAGAFSVVLESIPRELAARITSELRIPTIGIGAGPECDGQVLVLHDMIGLSLGHTPKFARRYANVGKAISNAVTAYAEDVREGRFPADAESYHLSSEVRERLLAVRRS
jgi:3-methyl-2-oxobutanoate hydroxymethyltransferase